MKYEINNSGKNEKHVLFHENLLKDEKTKRND